MLESCWLRGTDGVVDSTKFFSSHFALHQVTRPLNGTSERTLHWETSSFDRSLRLERILIFALKLKSLELVVRHAVNRLTVTIKTTHVVSQSKQML